MAENVTSTLRSKRAIEVRLLAVELVRALPKRNEKGFEEIAIKLGISVRSLYRWMHRFDAAGKDGLRDSRRRDVGKPRILRFVAASLLVLLKRAEGWNMRAIHRHLIRQWPQLHPGFRRPSYGMVSALISWVEKARAPKVQP